MSDKVDILVNDEITIDGVRYKIEGVSHQSDMVTRIKSLMRRATMTATVYRLQVSGIKKTGLAEYGTLRAFPVYPLEAKLYNSPAIKQPMQSVQTYVTDENRIAMLVLIDKTFTVN